MPDINIESILAIFISISTLATTIIGVFTWKIRKERKQAIQEYGIDETLGMLNKKVNELERKINDETVKAGLTHTEILQNINEEFDKLHKRINEISDKLHELRGYVSGIDKK